MQGRLELSEHPTPHPCGKGLSGHVIAAQAEVRVPGALIEMKDKTGHRGENGSAKVGHGSGVIISLRAA